MVTHHSKVKSWNLNSIINTFLNLLTLALLSKRLSLCEGILETRNHFALEKVTVSDRVVILRFRHHEGGAKFGQVVAARLHESRVQSTGKNEFYQ